MESLKTHRATNLDAFAYFVQTETLESAQFYKSVDFLENQS
jgi:hypothetical protein